MFFNFFKKNGKKAPIFTKDDIVFEPSGLEEFVVYIKSSCGIDLEPKKDVLTKKFSIYCKNNEIENFYKLVQLMKHDSSMMQEVIDLVTVNETYFYRELPQLQESVEYIKNLNKKVNILSAPCSTGEEVYSLAILAKEAKIKNTQINITGIDINTRAIMDAKEAIYTKRSLHRLDKTIQEKYFIQKDDGYHIIKDDLLDVDFRVVNIFDNEFKTLGRFDIIYSRNMMIYFNDEYKRKAIKIFCDALQPQGRLYTGHADLVPENEYFNKIVKNRLYFYEKK